MDISLLPSKNGFLRRNINQFIRPLTLSDIKSEIYNLKYDLLEFMKSIDGGTVRTKFIATEKFGIVKIGKNSAEGIIFSGDGINSKIQLLDNDVLKLSFISKSGKIRDSYEFKNDNIIEVSKADNTNNDIDEYLLNALESLSMKMSNLRRISREDMPKLYIPTKLEQEKLDKINKAISVAATNDPAIATTNEREQELCKEVLKQFIMVKEVYKKFNNPITRSNVKARYSNYDLPNSNANTCAFQKGYMGKPFQISVSQVSGMDYIIIRTPDKDGTQLIFTINSKGQILKNMPYQVKTLSTGIKKRSATKPEFYAPDELKDKNLETLLFRASKELERLAKHGETNLKNHAKFAEKHINSDIGSTKYLSPIINEIFSSIEQFKEKITKTYGHFKGRDELREKYDIDWSRRGIRINNATRNGKDLRLTFPSVLGKRATQLLVIDKDEKINKSFFILDDKLVKFEIKSIEDNFTHPNRQQYYYTQKEIKHSHLGEYLNIIREKIATINSEF